MAYTNKNEFRITALQRSGHHAIINWIMQNFAGDTCYLNNCSPQANPYLCFRGSDSLIGNVDIAKEKAGRFSRKDLLIYNYEDKELKEVYSKLFTSNIETWVGKSRAKKNLIVLRDPFNNFASKYKWAVHGKKWRPTMNKIRSLPGLWKSYAKEFLGETNQLPETKVCINYNQWFSSPEYRRRISLKLGLLTDDKGLEEVAKWGPNTWGDSFDDLIYDGRAHEMKVLSRWKYFQHDEIYKSLFNDDELVSLSQRIFGHIPGTDRLYS